MTSFSSFCLRFIKVLKNVQYVNILMYQYINSLPTNVSLLCYLGKHAL
jgi:fluoride ion exporter CrcB/FEX